ARLRAGIRRARGAIALVHATQVHAVRLGCGFLATAVGEAAGTHAGIRWTARRAVALVHATLRQAIAGQHIRHAGDAEAAGPDAGVRRAAGRAVALVGAAHVGAVDLGNVGEAVRAH